MKSNLILTLILKIVDQLSGTNKKKFERQVEKKYFYWKTKARKRKKKKKIKKRKSNI